VGVVDIEVFDDAKNLIAIGRATYSTLAPDPASRRGDTTLKGSRVVQEQR
jgi:hypothetical protein